MKKLLITLFLAGLTITLYAQGLELNLSEAIEKAYQHDYTLKNSELDLKNSKIKVKEAYKNFLPTVDYTGKYTSYDEEKTVNSQKVQDYYDNSVAATQPIFQGGSLMAQLSSAQSDRDKKNYQYEDTRINTMLGTINKYTSVLLKEKEVEVYGVALKNMESQYSKANRKYELDMIAKSEVLPFNTRVLNLKTKLLESKNGVETAKADLKNYIGIGSSKDILLKGIEEKDYDLNSIDLEKDIENARENNRNIKISTLDTLIKENEKVIARSEFLPKISAGITYRSGDERIKNSTDDISWEAGVNVKMNIFQFGQSIDRYERSKNEELKAKNLEEKAKDSVELNLRTSYLNLLKYRGIVEEQRSAVESARENFNLESRRYEMDLSDAVTLVEIEKNLVESELALIGAQFNYYLAYEQYKSLLK
ncbi:MAG: TolC family protein [Fusobacteriaceae bacterium]